jgi:hypothetical protein
VSGGVAEVFRSFGKRYLADEEKRLAAFLTSLPTDEDRSRFAEASRLFLSSDPVIRKLPAGRRRALLRAPTLQLLLDAADRVLSEHYSRVLSENHPDRGSELDKARLRMAQLIVAGIHATSRNVILQTALLLREASDKAQEVRSKSGGKSGRSEALADSSAQRGQWAARLKAEAEKLRQERPSLSQRARAEILNRRFRKQKLHYWPTPQAMIEFARRNRIKL